MAPTRALERRAREAGGLPRAEVGPSASVLPMAAEQHRKPAVGQPNMTKEALQAA